MTSSIEIIEFTTGGDPSARPVASIVVLHGLGADGRDFVPVALAKLVGHPLLVLLLGTTARRLGLAVDGFTLTVMTLVAALPSASNVSLLAERFGADTGRIARIILLTTAAAFFTFSGAVALLRA